MVTRSSCRLTVSSTGVSTTKRRIRVVPWLTTRLPTASVSSESWIVPPSEAVFAAIPTAGIAPVTGARVVVVCVRP